MTPSPVSRDRILVVDDTPANIDLLGAMLMDRYDVSAAVNGSTALEIADSTSPPDLILLDIMMPEMDGYEVARRLKHNPRTRDIPIIFVTAKTDEEDEAFGFDVGGVDYIRKPVNAAVTLARVKSHLELKQLRDRITRNLKHSEATARENLDYFRELFRSSPQGIILVDKAETIRRANRSFGDLIGNGEQKGPVDRRVSEILEGTELGISDLVKRVWEGEVVTTEAMCRHRDGYQVPVSLLAYPVKIQEHIQGVFIFVENISQRKLFEEQLKHQAFHDALTGIPNRQLFKQRLEYALARTRTTQGAGFTVLLIDLDRFKSVNDTLGHAAGDELLKAATLRIQKCLRAKDTLARLGGDEFAILLPGIHRKSLIRPIAERIRTAVEKPFTIQNRRVHISASIGIVSETREYEESDLLLRDADLAMYEAKDQGKARFRFFSPKSRDSLLASVTLETELRRAIDHDQLTLHYQPIIRVDDGSVSGFEALVRWDHPAKGLMMPMDFIPLAEESGLILPMGKWITREGCRRLAQWQQDFPGPLSMNINVSMKQFHEPGFMKSLMAMVDQAGISPCCIKLEFTESLLMARTDLAVQRLKALKQKGFTLEIDDFGTGYSSLSYLQQFPVDQIKIDKSFVQSMSQREESFEIVKSVISLSKSLGLSAVAEGVETPEQLDTLRQLSCDFAQGYLFAKPMPPHNAFTYLTQSCA